MFRLAPFWGWGERDADTGLPGLSPGPVQEAAANGKTVRGRFLPLPTRGHEAKTQSLPRDSAAPWRGLENAGDLPDGVPTHRTCAELNTRTPSSSEAAGERAAGSGREPRPEAQGGGVGAWPD